MEAPAVFRNADVPGPAPLISYLYYNLNKKSRKPALSRPGRPAGQGFGRPPYAASHPLSRRSQRASTSACMTAMSGSFR